MIHLDTNFLIRAMISGSAPESKLLQWIRAGEQIGISAIAWSEYLCGPLTQEDKRLALLLLASPESFGPADGEKAAELFNRTGRRSRSLADCQIAAVALRVNAQIATENEHDFRPFETFGLRVISIR
jgi:predicted nucleic acid-binding protein